MTICVKAFQILFTAIVLSVNLGIYAKVIFKFVKLGTEIDFNGIFDCRPKDWEKQYQRVPPYEKATEMSRGEYYCNPDIFVEIIVIEEELKFDVINHSLPMFETNITFVCSLLAWAHTGSTSILRITNSTDTIAETTLVSTATGKVSQKLEVPYILDTIGQTEFTCTWSISISVRSQEYSDEAKKMSSLYIYMPVRNVKPNVTIQRIAYSIICESESLPPPTEYLWSCISPSSANVTVQDKFLSINEKGNYSCTCTVKNIIENNIFQSSWNGYIQFVTEAEYKEMVNNSGKSVGIVVGVLVTIAVISAVVIALVVRQKKKKRVSDKLREMQSTTGSTKPEGEHLETDENPVYGKV